MTDNQLDTDFQAAYKKISEEATHLPPDIMLRIYAYYKQATKGMSHKDFNTMSKDLKNAFKFNAWSQVSHLTVEEAKKKYIQIANEIFKDD